MNRALSIVVLLAIVIGVGALVLFLRASGPRIQPSDTTSLSLNDVGTYRPSDPTAYGQSPRTTSTDLNGDLGQIVDQHIDTNAGSTVRTGGGATTPRGNGSVGTPNAPQENDTGGKVSNASSDSDSSTSLLKGVEKIITDLLHPEQKDTTVPAVPIPSTQEPPTLQSAVVSRPVCTMTIHPARIASGQSSEISWYSNNAQSASISGRGAVAPSGTMTVSPSQTSTYVATFHGAGDATCTVTLNVDPAATSINPPPDTIQYDTSSQNTVSETTTQCGIAHDLDIALVLDSSGSIDNVELAQMKSAFNGFVDQFLPARPTLFSVTEFDANAAVRQSFTGDIARIKSAIQVAVSGGSTNWEDGLLKAQSTFDPRNNVPNVIIFASDGNPNRINPGNDVAEAPALAAAVRVANSIKSSGTRIITLGIGNSTAQSGNTRTAGWGLSRLFGSLAGSSDILKPENLQAISSPNSYFTAQSFADLPAVLNQISSNLCTTPSSCTGGVCTTGNNCPTSTSRCGVGSEQGYMFSRTYSGASCTPTEQAFQCAGACTGGSCQVVSSVASMGGAGGMTCPSTAFRCGTGADSSTLYTRIYAGSTCAASDRSQHCQWGCTNGIGCNAAPPPPTINITAIPALVRSGATAAVTWSGVNVESCAVNSTNGDTWDGISGTQTSSPIISQTVYTLTCVGLDHSIPSKTATVGIVPVFNEQ